MSSLSNNHTQHASCEWVNWVLASGVCRYRVIESKASGYKSNEQAWIKPVHAGQCWYWLWSSCVTALTAARQMVIILLWWIEKLCLHHDQLHCLHQLHPTASNTCHNEASDVLTVMLVFSSSRPEAWCLLVVLVAGDGGAHHYGLSWKYWGQIV